MKHILTVILMLLAVALLGSCVTTDGEAQAADGAELKSTPMPEFDAVANTAKVWGGDDLAQFTYDYTYQGVNCLKVTQDYGATIWSYNFTGLEPNKPVRMRLDANVDTTEASAWVEVFWGPGHYDAPQDAWDERGDDHKWAAFGYEGWDLKWESGGFNPEKGILGTYTDDWETFVDTSKKADENGNFYVAIQTGHWNEFPPTVTHYFANLTVESLED